jgi:SEC-C motif-containing protein
MLGYTDCCGALLSGSRTATTAEQLMRSRYTAYVELATDYLLKTWHPSTRPIALKLHFDPPCQWTGLKIINTKAGLSGDDQGTVEFIARYKINGRAYRLHEISLFIKDRGNWTYLHAATDQ